MVALQPTARPHNVQYPIKHSVKPKTNNKRRVYIFTDGELNQLVMGSRCYFFILFLCNAAKSVLSQKGGRRSRRRRRGFCVREPHLHDEKVPPIFILVKSQ